MADSGPSERARLTVMVPPELLAGPLMLKAAPPLLTGGNANTRPADVRRVGLPEGQAHPSAAIAVNGHLEITNFPGSAHIWAPIASNAVLDAEVTTIGRRLAAGRAQDSRPR